MPKSAACPDALALEQFALGDIPIDEIDALAAHVSECASCIRQLDTVQRRDTLVDAMAKNAACGEAQNDLVQQLIARLKQAIPAAKDHSAEQPTISVHADSSQNIGEPSGDVTEEHYDFLAPAEQSGEMGRLGGYRVLRVLGAGGMGVVFEAEDEQLQRRVALKVMKPALAAGDSARKRFLREAQTTANLKNDHIVTIHQVGEDRGVPFLAMELLDGSSLADRLHKVKTLPAAQVLRLGQQIARGLSVAHEHGLIHRDIKPANIWIEPEAGGRAKLLDFGLARVANDDVHLTQPGAIVGTPAYMSPEQAQSKPVDERCDIFSLGCVLYRLTTGKTPFRGSDTIATLLSVATDEPTPPHEVNADVPCVLSDYIMRLLAKKPEDRPATAKDVEAELKRMANEPARPATVETTPKRWSRRRIAATVAIGLLLLIGGAIVLQQVIIRITGKDGKKRDIVVKPGEKVEIFTKKENKKGKRAVPKPPNGQWSIDQLSRDTISPYELKVAGGGDSAKAPTELVAVLGDSRMMHWTNVSALAFSPDGRFLASGCSPGPGGGRVTLWDVESMEQVGSFENGRSVLSIAFGRKGNTLAFSDTSFTYFLHRKTLEVKKKENLALSQIAFSKDGNYFAGAVKSSGAIQIWYYPTWKKWKTIEPNSMYIDRLGFSPDGKQLATQGGRKTKERVVGLYDVKTGEEINSHVIRKFPSRVVIDAENLRFLKHVDGQISYCNIDDGKVIQSWKSDHENELIRALDPSGKWIVALTRPFGGLRIYNLDSMQNVFEGRIGRGADLIEFDRLGRRMAIGYKQGGIDILDLDTMHFRWKSGTTFELPDVICGHDSENVVATVKGKRITIWEQVDRLPRAVDVLVGHKEPVTHVAFGAGKSKLFSLDKSTNLKCWSIPERKILYSLDIKMPVSAIAASRDGRYVGIATISDVAEVVVFHAKTGGQAFRFADFIGGIYELAFSPDGEHVAAGGFDGALYIYDLNTGRLKRKTAPQGGAIRSLAFSPCAKRIVIACGSAGALIWDLQINKFISKLLPSKKPATAAFFGPTANEAIVVTEDQDVFVMDTRTDKIARRLPIKMYHKEVGFIGRGRYICCKHTRDSFRVYDLTTGYEPLSTITFRSSAGFAETLSDNRHIVSTQAFGMICFWDLKSLCHLRKQPNRFTAKGGELTFSSDRTVLVNNSGTAWNLTNDKIALRYPWYGPAAFSRDDRMIAAGDGSDVVVWDQTSNRIVKTLSGHKLRIAAVAMSPDKSTIATGSWDQGIGMVVVWDWKKGKPKYSFDWRGIHQLAFNSSGKQLAVAAYGEKLLLLDVSNGTKVLLKSTDGSQSIAYSPDGSLLASAKPGMVQIWNPVTNALLHSIAIIPKHGVINHVTFTPDGRHIITANGNGTLYVLRLPEGLR